MEYDMVNPSVPIKPALFDGQRRYILSTSGPTMVGRQSCAILLSNPGVALQHARLNPTRSGYTLEMVGGDVFINGLLITSPTLLKPGDNVKIGEATLIYEGPAVSEILREQSLSYDALFDKVKGSVVGIRTHQGLGSGFFVHASGLLVTNRHVVEYEREVSVYSLEGKQFTGWVVRAFPEIDLAFVRVEGASPLVPPFSPSAMTRVGQAVLVIGHPMGLTNTLTKGIISAINREVMGNIFLQTDAAINPGNSGGPLFNELGEVVGVAAMGIGHSQGLNFAIPVELVQRRMEQFMGEEARVKRGQGVYCIVCGFFSTGGTYCPNCGVSVTEGSPIASGNLPTKPHVTCANCGKPLNPGDQFCPNCGNRV
jgi:S1-C subfamily serine protease